jgi:hypothetical protein
MPCEPYKDALVEAAATGREPQAELRAHLEACDACCSAFAEEQSLFSAIDTGLHSTVAAEVPASLLPRVRARLLDETPSQNRWILTWAPVAASVALLIGFLFFRGVRPDVRDSPIEPKQAIRGITPVETSASRPRNPPTQQALSASPVLRQLRQANPSREHKEPRALVPAEQPEVIARLLDGLRRGEVQGEVLLAESNGSQSQDLQIAPLTVAPIDLKALDGAQPNVD